MAQIRRFEDIEAWKKARELAKEIYVVTSRGAFARDFSLRDQIRRAAVSVCANIAEGFARQTDREFVQFLYTARGSVAEVQSQLYVARDLEYVSEDCFLGLYGMADDVSRMISGFIRYLKASRGASSTRASRPNDSGTRDSRRSTLNSGINDARTWDLRAHDSRLGTHDSRPMRRCSAWQRQ